MSAMMLAGLRRTARAAIASVAGALLLWAPPTARSEPPQAVLDYRHHMFDPPIMTLANRTVELMFDTARIEPDTSHWVLPTAAHELDFSYEFRRQVHRAADIFDDTHTDALLIIKDGVIVNETYLNRTDEHTHFMSYSMAKTLNSIMLGFALQDGYIAAVTDPVVKYIPELKGTAYDGATLQDVLRMRSGSDWDDNFFIPGPAKDINEQAFMKGDKRFVSAAFAARRAHLPGSFFNYNTVDAAVIGLVLERAVGEPISRYMKRRLWGPAGMENYGFYVLDGPPGVGREFTGGGFNAVLRDYGRLGLMMMQGGLANGKRLLPTDWVTESTAATTSPQETHNPALGYGYFWWTVAGTSAYTAIGGEGQFIFVDPVTRTVVIEFSHSPVGPAFRDAEAESIAFFKSAAKWQPQRGDDLDASRSPPTESKVGGAADASVRTQDSSTSADPMTREKFSAYVRRFNDRDERYADLYGDDVLFEHGPYYGALRGRQAIVNFYRNTWKSFAETLVPGQVVIDSEHGLMAAEMTTHLVALVDGAKSQSHPQGLKAGDEVVSVGVVIYAIKDGRIIHIQGAPEKSSFIGANRPKARAPLPASAEPLTPQVRVAIEAGYRQYLDCFNRRDVECFTNFYDDNVVFVTSPLPEMNGSGEIAAFYQHAWKHLREHLVVRSVSVTNGELKADLQNTIDVFEDYPDFPPRPLKKGDHFTIHGTLSYQLRAGRFTRIGDED